MLAQADKRAGLNYLDYAKGVPDPFAAVFSEHVGSGKIGMALVEGGIDLGNLKIAELEERFDSGFVQEFMSNPLEVYNSLPEPVKATLRELAMQEVPANGKEPPVESHMHGGHGEGRQWDIGDPTPVGQLGATYGNGSAVD
jgi:hypothetical protein